jgi:hypothetical protein
MFRRMSLCLSSCKEERMREIKHFETPRESDRWKFWICNKREMKLLCTHLGNENICAKKNEVRYLVISPLVTRTTFLTKFCWSFRQSSYLVISEFHFFRFSKFWP